MKYTLPAKNDFYPLLKLALPLTLMGAANSAVFFFETLFFAHVGVDALAAGGLVSWLFGTFVVILFGALSSINILVSHKFGANDHQGIARVARDGLALGLLLSIPAFLLCWNAAPLFLWVGQSPAVVALTKTYLHALAWSVFPNLIAMALQEFIVGLGHARTVTVFAIIAVLLNVFFSFIFIFGKLGMPVLGIAGAGWGITASQWLILFFLSGYVLFNREYRNYFRYVITFTKPSFVLELLQVGVPIGLMYCIEVGFFFALNLVMGYLGSSLLAANQIALQYLCLLMSVIFSIAQAVTVRMGHLLGAGDPRSAERAAYAGVSLAFLFMSVVALCFWFFPKVLIGIDFDVDLPKNFAIVRYAMQFLIISAVFQIVEGVRIALFGALRGLKETRFTLWASVLCYWGIALPVGYLLAVKLNLSGSGLWLAMTLGASVSVFLLWGRFKMKMRRYIPITLQ